MGKGSIDIRKKVRTFLKTNIIDPAQRTKEGRNGGTWAHPE